MSADILSTQSAELVQPAEPANVSTARHFTSEMLVMWGLAREDRDCAELIVDELAANAARYGRAEMSVRLTICGRGLVITVTDTGDVKAESPGQVDGTPPDEHGRGLDIVRRLAGSTAIHDDEHTHRVVTTRCLAPLHRPVTPAGSAQPV